MLVELFVSSWESLFFSLHVDGTECIVWCCLWYVHLVVLLRLQLRSLMFFVWWATASMCLLWLTHIGIVISYAMCVKWLSSHTIKDVINQTGMELAICICIAFSHCMRYALVSWYAWQWVSFAPVLVTIVSFCRTRVLISHKLSLLGTVLIRGPLWVGYTLVDNLGMMHWLLTLVCYNQNEI